MTQRTKQNSNEYIRYGELKILHMLRHVHDRFFILSLFSSTIQLSICWPIRIYSVCFIRACCRLFLSFRWSVRLEFNSSASEISSRVLTVHSMFSIWWFRPSFFLRFHCFSSLVVTVSLACTHRTETSGTMNAGLVHWFPITSMQ